MRYGHFDDDRREYVITRPDTPLPWINYLGSEDYFGIISNTAGGYSFYRDARLRRLTRYRYNNAPLDLGGRYLYLRDDDSGDFWSPSWQPTQRDLEDYSCRHGLGYSIIGSRYAGIRGRDALLRAARREPRDLAGPRHERAARAGAGSRSSARSSSACGTRSTTPPTSSATTRSARSRSRTASSTTRPSTASGATTSPTSPARSRWPASTRSATRSSGPTAAGTGRIVVERGQAADSDRPRLAADRLAPRPARARARRDAGRSSSCSATRRTRRTTSSIRPARRRSTSGPVRPIIARYLAAGGRGGGASQALRDYWTDLLGTLQVETGNEHVDRMVNIWNAYQCMVTFNLSRSASLFESGIGRGMGFRDSNQDLLGFVHMVPARARERILDIAATQLPTGGAYHQYQPLTKRGNNDVGSRLQRRPGLAGAGRGRVPQGDRRRVDPRRAGRRTTTSRAPRRRCTSTSSARIGYTLDRLGPHGLPLIGRADWNDCLNLNCFSETPGESFQTTENKDGGVAESVFIGGLFVLAAERDGRRSRTLRGDAAEAARCRDAAADDDRRRRDGRLGRRLVPARLRLLRQRRRLARNATKARSSSSRRACASWPASASTTAGPARRWPPSASAWPRRTASSCTARPTRTTT